MVSLFIVLAVITVACASPAYETRILGGAAAKVKQFPYQVSLRYYFSNRHFCGGSILADRWVISAAHCTKEETKEMIRVAVGTIIINEGELYDIERIINHEQFGGATPNNDISLLKTKAAIKFSDLVQPIPIRTTKVLGGEDVVVSGWGRTRYPGPYDNKNLQYIALKTITNEECVRRLADRTDEHISRPFNAYNGSLCTFTKKNEGTCKGDSGGPLAINGELVGLVSWGEPCAVGFPDINTRLSEFIAWVKDKMDNN